MKLWLFDTQKNKTKWAMTSICLLTCKKYLQNHVKELRNDKGGVLKKKKKRKLKGLSFKSPFFLLLKDNLLLGFYHFHSSRTVLMTTQGENIRSPSGANMKTVLQFKRPWPAMLALNKLTMYHKLINSTLWSLKCQLFSLISSFIRTLKLKGLILNVTVFKMFIYKYFFYHSVDLIENCKIAWNIKYYNITVL